MPLLKSIHSFFWDIAFNLSPLQNIKMMNFGTKAFQSKKLKLINNHWMYSEQYIFRVGQIVIVTTLHYLIISLTRSKPWNRKLFELLGKTYNWWITLPFAPKARNNLLLIEFIEILENYRNCQSLPFNLLLIFIVNKRHEFPKIAYSQICLW